MEIKKLDINELKKIANKVRQGVIIGTHAAKSGHPGGSLSAADIFTYLFFEELNIDPKNPDKRQICPQQRSYGTRVLCRIG